MVNLAAALNDPVGFVRVWAAAALAQVAPSCGELVTVLIAELGDELAFVRSLAAWHLGRLVRRSLRSTKPSSPFDG